jgi:hypothetical protein
MRQQRVFLQFFESDSGVVVVHGFPQKQMSRKLLYSLSVALKKLSRGRNRRIRDCQAAVAAAGMNS